ncbi:MAG: AraC family transcriptional regulator, partial [Alphaproteobacteria bacterium HGW-Alphaproteobacteria-16]
MEKIDHLAEIIARHMPEPGLIQTNVPRLSLIRADEPSSPVPAVYEASLCMIVQGAKRVSL